jgi:uncharacterized protein with von Willebrand factor type A (vWA) domain
MAENSGKLLHNLLLFGRLLRMLGLDVNLGRMIDLVQALKLVDIGNRSDFYHTARSLLVHNKEDIPLFDEAFEIFWRHDWGGAGTDASLDGGAGMESGYAVFSKAGTRAGRLGRYAKDVEAQSQVWGRGAALGAQGA